MSSNRSSVARSRSNSPDSTQSELVTGSVRSGSRSRSRSRSRSASGSRGSNRSRSNSADSGKSNRSHGSVNSVRSRHSDRSGSKTPSQKSRSRSRSRSRSASRSSRSRSGSANSQRSHGSNVSRGSNGSGDRSRSRSRSGSRSNGSQSGSAGSVKSNRSRSRSIHSGRSGSKTPSHKSRSRSRSKSGSVRSRSGSVTPTGGSPRGSHRGDEGSDNDKDADAADLFGDADDISSDEDKGKEHKSSERKSDEEIAESNEQDDNRMSEDEHEDHETEDKEAEVEMIPETRIDVNIPKISCDLGKEIHFVKLPNFLSVETRPFDSETYEDEIDEEETLDEEGRARLKLKVENTIRWRDDVNKEGDMEKHSNARLVRWSDGSLSLHLGAEIFDVYKQPLQGDHNHLFIRQGTGLQGQAVFRTKLSFRPHSTESFTHRKMTLSLADRSQKTSGIKILSQVGVNPDQDRKTLLKKEEEKLRQAVRQTKPRKRADTARLHVGQAYREEEGSEDEGAISLNAIKNKYKSGSQFPNKGGAIYSSDEEGSDFEARRMKKQDKPKALKDFESSESD